MRTIVAGWLIGIVLPVCAGAQPASCDAVPHGASGCAFRALSLPNPSLDQATFPFSVELYNPLDGTTNVSVEGGALASPLGATIAPRATVVLELPWVATVSTSTATLEVANAAYRITTSRPVVAMQWNSRSPIRSGMVSSANDGSLLRPEQTAATMYRVSTWPSQNLGGPTYPGYVAVIALANATSVSVSAAGGIQAGPGLTATGGTVSLDDGDVLLVSSALDAPSGGTGSDLSGALVTSDKPVLAFAGHALASVPNGASFADHLEEALPSVGLLGTDHLVVRPAAPPGSSGPARHIVKIVGHTPANLATSPSVAGVPTTIAAGQSISFEATTDFRLVSSAPVLVASFLEGSSQFGGGTSQGDPSLTFVVPLTQAQSRIDFVAPAIHAPATALVSAPTGTSVVIDGVTVAGWNAIGSTGFAFAQFGLGTASDAHTATGTAPFTLAVNAYPSGASTSYAYPASFELRTLLFADGFESP